ncbi:MAG: hypothetical protein HXX13_04230 [Bacteroidetes bacterium]|nr:hypothetical protein [Bacteroidota bacterium]
MKKLQLIPAGILLFFAVAAQAQVSMSINIGTPPPWGPVGYAEARYYYLPDVQAYYDLQTSLFIYSSGGRWIHRTYLPGRYRNYDLYNGYKVVMTDYHGDAPYAHYREYRTKYHRGYHGEAQRTIGERPGRGNMGPGNSHEQNHQRQGVRQNNGRNQKQNNGHDGGKGKKR